jgi:hypothetical protein
MELTEEDKHMMAGLFLIFTLAMISIYAKKRELAISILVLALLLSLMMFYYHATDILEINW